MKLKHKLKRDDVIEAVLEIILEEGPEQVGAIAVARRLGTEPQAPYRFFNGREEMIDAALQSIHDTLVHELLSAERHAPGPLQALHIFLNQCGELLPFMSIVPRLLLSGVDQPGEAKAEQTLRLAKRVSERESELEGHLRRILHAAQQAGEVRNDMTVPALTRTFTGCAIQMYNHWARTSGHINLHEETKLVWEQFCHKVVPPPIN